MAQTFLSMAERAPFAQIFAQVQQTHPLVDCITNIVTVNDVANGLLAIDARPVMASAPEEIAFFMERADALLLNLGATGAEQRTAMLAGAEAANALAKPVVVDPGASAHRRCAATRWQSCWRRGRSAASAATSARSKRWPVFRQTPAAWTRRNQISPILQRSRWLRAWRESWQLLTTP